ncbi:MAG: hypothetical protein JNL38_02300 [Myxococcales bacterium]|nr:hypothetical protein [Myxococcales bacterium]
MRFALLLPIASRHLVAALAVLSASTLALACGDASPEGSSSGGSSTSSGGGSSGGSSSGGSSTSSSGASGSGSSSSGGADGGVAKLTPGSSTLSITAAGKTRTVNLVVPTSVSAGKVPLVLALHGNGDSASNFVKTSGLAAYAETKGYVLAAPQGISQSFTYQGQPVNGVDWDAYRTRGDGNIDLALLDALKQKLVASGSIDEKRVMVYGYSQGGYLSFHYGIVGSAETSCAAVLAAASPLGTSFVQQATRKIPFALQIGANDGAAAAARQSRDALQGKGHPVQYDEIPGAPHVPIPGDPKKPLDYCMMQVLP